ncbi:LPXTG cell wall anchor domain-containing protein [Bifidobacterium gallicum]|uniref:Cell surface protein n=1 Tax=Bifidobacterium gallicum DSM 20093 = LMG 11596 TaxID=561180 RepID=A0A087AJ61_9BIFI|nr:LPXTG cell wall anchor domain-containing protein [Bifidobacterium gallicum]KFI58811.1 Cell surface protein [Bifidobacterium gallicum DSM 20093 = LMG 11596]
MGTHTNRRGCQRVVAAALSAAFVMGFAAPGAYATGGEGDQSGTGGSQAMGLVWAYKDENTGSFGPASDMQSVLNAYQSVNLPISDAGRTRAQRALDESRAECELTFANKHPGEGPANCRVVGVGVAYNSTLGKDDGSGKAVTSSWIDEWNNTVAPRTYAHEGQTYRVGDPFEDDPSTSVRALMERGANKGDTGIIILTLNKYQPQGPQEYDLSVSTQTAATTTSAGATNPVSDTIKLSRGNSDITEQVNGTITLTWRGVDGSTRQTSKQFNATNNANTTVSFTHTQVDSSWQCWPAGKFWFDVTIPKQGKMKTAATHQGENDAKESWSSTLPDPSKTIVNAAGDTIANPNEYLPSGSLYTATITAQSSASTRFWLYDTIRLGADRVHIGAVDHDDLSAVYVTDPSGKRAGADISVDDSVSGQRTVKAFVKTPASGLYTLVVPQATVPSDKDYVIHDDSSACWNGDGHMCQSGNGREVTKVTPTPNKSWVLDEQGVLSANDPQWTNKTGADTKTFVPGDSVGAVVNGRIPAHLFNMFTSYQIIDDWTASAPYIDWNRPQDVRVYVDGQDQTNEFDITIDPTAHRTIATAHSSFLRATAFNTTDKTVTLYVAGVFKKNPTPGSNTTMTNAGLEIWNNEDKPTNKPPVYTRTPHPNKSWSVDEGSANQSEDPEWTNQVSADQRTFIQHDTFAVTVNGLLPKNLAKDLHTYQIADNWDQAATYIDMDSLKATISVDGVDKTSEFTITTSQHTTTATAKPTLLKASANQTNDRTVRMVITGTFKPNALKAGHSVTIPNQGWEQWNNQPVTTNQPPVTIWTPNPDKSWVRLGADGQWDTVIDPKETNTTGADNMVFLDEERVASVVNGTIAANLATTPSALALIDDYANADYIWDADDPAAYKVYDVDVDTDAASSFTDIARKGRDVTALFTIAKDGTMVTANAKPEYLAQLQGMGKARQLTLLIPGTIRYAHSQGAAQVRHDFGKQAGDEVAFCTSPQGQALTNRGAQTIADTREATNEPKICGYVPPVVKDVVAEASQGGDQESVNGKTVFPGQRVEYQLTTHPKLASNLAYDVRQVIIRDEYDPYLHPDRQTMEITDLHTGKSVSKQHYETVWDDTAHTVTLTLRDDYVATNWPKGSDPSIMIRFEGTVDNNAPTDRKVANKWALTLNNALTPSNIVHNTPPDTTPDKHITQQDASIDIDGKTALLGDTIYYQITLDAAKLTEHNTAYQVHRLGIIDDWDEEYLRLNEPAVHILNDSGQDVTDAFNIQHKDGVTYAFAKLADTHIPATGEIIPGDPQPDDLAAYATRDHDPLTEPSIDQTMLGHTYTLVLPMSVIKVSDNTTITNQATQITNNHRVQTRQVSTPLQPINPSKDVVVTIGETSANNTSIRKGQTFLYQLDSSTLPANRAYPQITQWDITDPLDTTHDRYTGQWAVYATHDVYDGDMIIATTGERIAGTTIDPTPYGGELFTLQHNNQGELTISATRRWLDLASAADTIGFRVYIQCERIAPGDHITNTFQETINGTTRPSNTVTTHTPDLTASITVEKYDLATGPKEGDRDTTDKALNMTSDTTPIGITITNTSNTDDTGAGMSLTNLTLNDQLINGSGELTNITYPDNWNELILKPGQSITLEATLTGVHEDDTHTNRINVTATPIIECPITDPDPFDNTPGTSANTHCADTQAVADHDDWNGKRPAALAHTGTNVMWIVIAALVAVFVACALIGLASARGIRHAHRKSGAHSNR